ARGLLRTHAGSTYKIPTAGDRPRDMRIQLFERGINVEDTIFRSKAVGEPPLMLANSVHGALTDAVNSLAADGVFVPLDAPATPERILWACERARRGGA